MIILGVAAVIFAVVLLARYLLRNGPENELRLSGNVEVTEANLGFKYPGRIVELLVEEGDQVREGQTIARLDSAEAEAVTAQSRSALQEASVRLAELRAGSRTQEIAQVAAQVAAQEAELLRVRRDFERAELLYKNGAISASQYDSAKSAYEARRAQHKIAQEALSLVKEGPRQEDIRVAEHRRAQAKAVLDASQQRLKDTVLTAPLTGVVLRKNLERGETVGAGVPVYTIGDLKSPWIKVYVPEPSIGKVRLGQDARLTTDSFPNKTYEGKISFISSETEFTPKQVQTQEERVKLVFGVKVTVDNERDELKPGMPADVTIRLHR
ncbi:MAG TPA: ABC transporter substrate-binding protein [Deltaproteobacteria bacterium]|nr:ABC transporter substrate-binding protein [Deltaproteobacteria bacterium]